MHSFSSDRLQNSPYFCLFNYARAVKQKVSNKAENRERDWGETLKTRVRLALRARKTLTPRFTEFFTDFEKKTTVLQSIVRSASSLVSAIESSWTSTVPTLRFPPFKQLEPNLCCRQSLEETRIISKRDWHMSFWDRKLELTLWLCGRRAQSTSLITN